MNSKKGIVYVPETKPKFIYTKTGLWTVVILTFILAVMVTIGANGVLRGNLSMKSDAKELSVKNSTKLTSQNSNTTQSTPLPSLSPKPKRKFDIKYEKQTEAWNVYLDGKIVKTISGISGTCLKYPDPVLADNDLKVYYVADQNKIKYLDLDLVENLVYTLPNKYKLIGSFFLKEDEIGVVGLDKTPVGWDVYQTNPKLRAKSVLLLDQKEISIEDAKTARGYKTLKYFNNENFVLADESNCSAPGGSGSRNFEVYYRETAKVEKPYPGASIIYHDDEKLIAISGLRDTGIGKSQVIKINTSDFTEEVLKELTNGSIVFEKQAEGKLYFSFTEYEETEEDGIVEKDKGNFEIKL